MAFQLLDVIAAQAAEAEQPQEPEVVYCVCRQADDPNRAFIECEECQEWFHPECVGTTLQVRSLSCLPDIVTTYNQATNQSASENYVT